MVLNNYLRFNEVTLDKYMTYTANTQRNKHVVMKSKRRFDVIITCLLHFAFEEQIKQPQQHKLIRVDPLYRIDEILFLPQSQWCIHSTKQYAKQNKA